jgi:hypothetical protein
MRPDQPLRSANEPGPGEFQTFHVLGAETINPAVPQGGPERIAPPICRPVADGLGVWVGNMEKIWAFLASTNPHQEVRALKLELSLVILQSQALKLFANYLCDRGFAARGDWDSVSL